LQPFEVPELSTRFDVFNFIQTSNNLVTSYSILFDLLVNLEQGQELAQLEFDLEFLELSRSVNKGDSSTNIIKQKLADIEVLKAKNFKHNNIETVETIKLIKDILDSLDLIAKDKGTKLFAQFSKIKTDIFLGCKLQQENAKPNIPSIPTPKIVKDNKYSVHYIPGGDKDLFSRDSLVTCPYAETPQKVIEKCQYLKQYQNINQED
jgi:hypothetical protein